MPKDSPLRIPTLDGLRAISIVVVLAAHSLGTRNLPWIPKLQVLADLGVRAFFVISGFLITTLLVRERAKHGRISLRGFYIRRAFRIFPAFYTYLITIAVVAAIGWVTISRGDFALAATYTMNFRIDRAWEVGHLWSLAVEEQFYLIWPLTLVLLGTRRGLYAALAALAIAPILRLLAWSLWPDVRELTDQAFPFVFDSLATGCVLAMGRDWLEASPRYTACLDAWWFWVVPLVGVLALAVPRPYFNLGVGTIVGNLGIALAIHRCVRHPTAKVSRFLELPVCVWVGTLSYSLYLWQQPFINRHADSWVNAFPINVGFAVAVAIVSYYVVERPVLRYRARRAAALRG